MLAAESMADRPFLLPNCPSLSSPLLSSPSDNSFRTTFSTTFPIQLSRDMERYAFRFVYLSLPGLGIITPLGRFNTAGCLPVPMAPSAKNISVRAEWLRQSGRALSELSETPRWQITPRPAPIPRVALHIAL